jgi:hypothetical protein
MLDSKIGVGVIAVCPEAGEGCHDYSVPEGEVGEPDGLEEFGSGHFPAMLLLGMIAPAKSPFL